MAKKVENNEPRVDFSSDLIMQLNEDKKIFNEGVFEYKLPNELADKAYPLKFKETKELKEKFDLVNLSTNGQIDGFLAEVLRMRGVSEAQLDDLSYSDLIMFAYRVYLGTFDAQSIAAKK